MTNNQSKTVLITGASTGIGLSTALEMANQGYNVIAGVRKESDAQKLKDLSQNKIQTVILDVTKSEDIVRVTQELSSQLAETGLYSLINNAGINYTAPFEYTVEEKARGMMEINFFGLYKMTQNFIPLLRKYREVNPDQRPKLINIGSIGSVIGLPWQSFYHASKFAVYSLSESLRLELGPLNIDVTVVMPGGIKTEFYTKTDQLANQASSDLPPEAPNHYRVAMKRFSSLATQTEKYLTSSEITGKRITSLLNRRKSPFMFLIGIDAKSIFYSIRVFPRSWIQWPLKWLSK